VTSPKARSVAVNYEGAANVWLAERIADGVKHIPGLRGVLKLITNDD
jgi:hypothetical protein